MEKDTKTIHENTSPTPILSAQEVEKLLQDNYLLSQKNSQLETSLESALAKIQWFEEQFKLHRH